MLNQLSSSLTLRSLLQEEPAGSTFDPQDTAYLREKFGAAIACFVVGILVVIAFLLFFLIRWCCCCAGVVRSAPILDKVGLFWQMLAIRELAVMRSCAPVPGDGTHAHTHNTMLLSL